MRDSGYASETNAKLDHTLKAYGRLERKHADLKRERNRYREALEEIAEDLGHPGKPEWRCAMEALGLDADAAERAWH